MYVPWFESWHHPLKVGVRLVAVVRSHDLVVEDEVRVPEVVHQRSVFLVRQYPEIPVP